VPRRYLPWVCLGMIAVSLTARLALVSYRFDSSEAASWVNTFARLDPLAIGALISLAWARRPWTLPPGIQWLLLLSGSVGLTVMHDRGLVPLPSMHLVWTYLASAVILGFVVAATLGSGHSVLATRPLVYLGRISYGLYVFHVPVLAEASPLHDWQLPWFVRLPIAFGLTVAIAALSYRFLEQPFLRLKERFTHVRSSPVQLGGA
jgi:peptidoglycan/LPS O-acetylase OafA/YrhL